MSANPPTVPLGSSGLEGWTSCCDAAVTYHDATLCCKGCWREVWPVSIDPERAESLDRIIRDVLEDRITAGEGVARQRLLLAPRVVAVCDGPVDAEWNPDAPEPAFRKGDAFPVASMSEHGGVLYLALRDGAAILTAQASAFQVP